MGFGTFGRNSFSKSKKDESTGGRRRHDEDSSDGNRGSDRRPSDPNYTKWIVALVFVVGLGLTGIWYEVGHGVTETSKGGKTRPGVDPDVERIKREQEKLENEKRELEAQRRGSEKERQALKSQLEGLSAKSQEDTAKLNAALAAQAEKEREDAAKAQAQAKREHDLADEVAKQQAMLAGIAAKEAQRSAAEEAATRAAAQPKSYMIPAGTVISISLRQSITGTRNVGYRFTGLIEQPINSSGRELLPERSVVQGRIVSVADEKNSNRSQLALELISVKVGSNDYPVASKQYQVHGKAQGGIVLRGERLNIPDDTVIDFTLAQPINVLQ